MSPEEFAKIPVGTTVWIGVWNLRNAYVDVKWNPGTVVRTVRLLEWCDRGMDRLIAPCPHKYVTSIPAKATFMSRNAALEYVLFDATSRSGADYALLQQIRAELGDQACRVSDDDDLPVTE